MMKLGVYIIALFGFCSLAQASVLLSEADFLAALQNEFMEQGRDENIELEFFGGQTSFVFEDTKKAKIMISQLKIDDEQGRFSVKAEIFADGKLVDTSMLNGKFYVLGEVYVPATDVSKGEVIKDNMLELKEIRLNRVKDTHIISADKLIGKQAKKKLKAGKLIGDRDVSDVVVVKRGNLLTSVYKKKGLQITAQVTALEDGYKGQIIEVENTKSVKKFTARVIDAQTVEIVTE